MAANIRLTDEFYTGRWEQANIPIRFRGRTLDDYENPHSSGMRALDKAREFVNNFEEHYVSAKRAAAGVFPEDRTNIGRGLLFVGRNGTRKSSLATAILTEVQYRSPAYHGFYIRFSDWKKAITDTFDKENQEQKAKAQVILNKAFNARLLVLDDIGQEHRTASGFTESSLHEFIRIRYEAARPTIITTNLSVPEILPVYGESFESFRHDAFHKPIIIVGADTRKTED